jgi:3-hydroxyacyl-[acyl-carrier-protein] dehydratase
MPFFLINYLDPKKNKKVFNFKEIRKLLPHKYPFLLLDRVLEIEKGKRIVCLKNVTGNENFFVGHFPEEPIMPGVLIIEVIAQAAALLMLLSKRKNRKGKGILGMVEKMYFFKPVFPGDQLKIEVEIVRYFKKFLLVSGKVTVEGEIVAKGNLGFGNKED